MPFASFKTTKTSLCLASVSRAASIAQVRSFTVKALFGVFALGLAQCASQAQEPYKSQAAAPPAALTPPDGNAPFLTAHATGTQDYICLPSSDTQTPAWVFYGPQATLSVSPFGTTEQQVVTHFLSPADNAALNALPSCTVSTETQELNCPTWQSSFDSSAVWGEKLASITAGSDQSCPNTGAIPCLLLGAVATRKGNFGPGYLTNTTYVQRLNTAGGAAPTESCKVGDQALVPYSADYTFFKKTPTE